VGERNIGRLPHPEVLKRYQQVGATLYRTDTQGAITVNTDGENIDVKTFHEERKGIFRRRPYGSNSGSD
jgi:competence protein ComEC